jgi:hypothetical protein
LVTYVAMLDVPRPVVEHLSHLLAAHRRALGIFRQAVLILRWFRTRGCIHCLAREMPASPGPPATATRREGIDVLAEQPPHPHEVLVP